jgi:ribose transport system permease protein
MTLSVASHVPFRARAGAAVVLLARYGIYVGLVLLCVCGALLSSAFLTSTNFLNIGLSVGYVGFVAIGMAFVVIGGSLIDLSIPGVIAGAGIIALATEPAIGALPAIVLAIAVGCFVGLLNGAAVGYLGANPVLVTYSAQIIILGIAQALAGAGFIYAHGAAFNWLGNATIAGVPLVLPILAACLLGAYVALSRSTFGRQVFATGGGYQASRVAGLPVRRVVMTTFVISGALAAVAGVLMSTALGSAQQEIGIGYEFNAITAVAIGGTSLFGGEGSIGRVLAGVLLVGVLNNVMILAGVSIDSQGIVKGAIIVGAVALDVVLRRVRTR